MKKIYIVRLASLNNEAASNYYKSILRKIAQKDIENLLRNDTDLRNRIRNLFGNDDFNVWGSKKSLLDLNTRSQNMVHFNKMNPGDYIIFVLDDHIRHLGEIVTTMTNPLLAKELWFNQEYSLIYFIHNLVSFNFSFIKFKELVNWKEEGNPYGFTSLEKKRLKEFYSSYGGDLHSILKNLDKK